MLPAGTSKSHRYTEIVRKETTTTSQQIPISKSVQCTDVVDSSNLKRNTFNENSIKNALSELGNINTKSVKSGSKTRVTADANSLSICKRQSKLIDIMLSSKKHVTADVNSQSICKRQSKLMDIGLSSKSVPIVNECSNETLSAGSLPKRSCHTQTSPQVHRCVCDCMKRHKVDSLYVVAMDSGLLDNQHALVREHHVTCKHNKG